MLDANAVLLYVRSHKVGIGNSERRRGIQCIIIGERAGNLKRRSGYGREACGYSAGQTAFGHQGLQAGVRNIYVVIERRDGLVVHERNRVSAAQSSLAIPKN